MRDDLNADIRNSDERRERILELREKLRSRFNDLSPETRQAAERIIRNGEDMEDMPPDHINALDQIEDGQPRSVLALNLLEQMRARENGEQMIRQWRADEDAEADEETQAGAPKAASGDTPGNDKPSPPPAPRPPTLH